MTDVRDKTVFQQIPILNAASIAVGELVAYNGVYNNWTVEPYNRCSFRCPYCSPDSQGLSTPTVPAESLIEILETELNAAYNYPIALKQDVPICISRLADPYGPEEETHKITRTIIEYLIARNQNFTITTKSILIRRDLDLFVRYKDKCSIRVSIPFSDDEINSQIDTYTPSPTERFKLVEEFHNAGVNIMIAVSPWIPGLSNVKEVLQKRPSDVFVEMYPLDMGDFMNKQYFLNTDLVVSDGLSKATAENLYDRLLGIAREGVCSSTKNKFSRQWSQDELHRLYIIERNRIGFVRKTAWCYPPGWQGYNTFEKLRYLMPNEIRLSTGEK